MERHIGSWHKETVPQKSKIAELIIDGNSIEFLVVFTAKYFPLHSLETMVNLTTRFL